MARKNWRNNSFKKTYVKSQIRGKVDRCNKNPPLPKMRPDAIEKITSNNVPSLEINLPEAGEAPHRTADFYKSVENSLAFSTRQSKMKGGK